jgi:LmbE family N-acetylglucosaminyl deacetylase
VRRALGLFLLCCTGAAGPARGQQLSPAGTGGVAALADALQHLGANKRVLVIGAHPDDENTQLLTWLSRGQGVQAAYLSLTRGEGGQNLIGPELGPELGVIRTEELLAARRLDGARQFFTRAYDFGFSKSADESFRFWPRDSLLKDVIDVIRRFRPQIVVAIFSGTPRDGHGQHQVAGALARQAFDALRDSSWGPVKLYRSAFFDTSGTTTTMPAGALDPLVGQSYFQIAMASRSQHRSQDMGQLQRPGPNTIRLAFVAGRSASAAPPAAPLFAGVDTTWPGTGAYAALIDSARARLNPYAPGAIVPYLARALDALGGASAEQREILRGALAAAAGVSFDATAEDGVVIPGQRLQIEATVWNAGSAAIRLDSATVSAPPGWEVQRLDPAAAAVGPDSVTVKRFAVPVAASAERSRPYFLRRPLAGALYDWSGVPADVRALPFDPPPVTAHAWLTVAGRGIELQREVVYRYRDQGIGEIRRPLFVTQPFEVVLAPSLVVWPVDGPFSGPRHFTVTVTNRTRGPAVGRVVVTVPRGWTATAAESLAFAREDETKSVVLTVSAPPPSAGGGDPATTVELRAAVVGQDGARSEGALAVIDYPHIRPRPVVHPSTAEIRRARIALPPVARVGYVRGASDRVPEALAAVGVPIELLDADTLARGDLSRYDAIVIGSRAYEIDPALVANNGRLLDYARAGGLVVVQYQQYPFIQGGFAPYRLSIAQPHDRVTDETAPVTLLDSAHAAFRSPNVITARDWQGWVQERGLYFAHDWDSAYTPLLRMHDPGEAPLDGGLLVAPLGRGTYVYTGVAFFRELPAGVTGAYRLFANLLGLGRGNRVP